MKEISIYEEYLHECQYETGLRLLRHEYVHNPAVFVMLASHDGLREIYIEFSFNHSSEWF